MKEKPVSSQAAGLNKYIYKKIKGRFYVCIRRKNEPSRNSKCH